VILAKKRSAKGELVFTSFLFLAGVVVLWDASQLPELASADFVGTKTYPSIVGWLLVILSVLQLISVARGNLGEPEGVEGGQVESKLRLRPFFLMIAGLLVFALGLPVIGFPIAATILFTLVVYALNPVKTKWFIAVPIAAATAAVVYFGFTIGLQIDLPWGFNFDFGPAEVVVEEDW
jgi:putative tricarboxylic transport membrane protein